MHPPARALGLPMASARAVWVVTGAVLLVYLVTQHRDLSAWDSALIALVAEQGGVGHPPGYPLHTWLGFLLARLPGVPPPMSIGWLSAIPGALLVVPVASLAWQLAPADPGAAPPPNPRLRHAPTVAAGVVLAGMALHPAWWDPATRIEVYSLAAFLAVWALARLATALELHADTAPPVPPRALVPVGLGFGLAAAVHPVVAALVATASFPWLVGALRRRRISLQTLVAGLAGGVAGLTPYLAIPLVARRQGPFIWGEPTSAAEFWRFLRGADFAAKVGPTGAQIGDHVLDWFGWAAASGVLPLLALGVAGWWLLGRRRPVGVLAGPLSAALAVLAIAANVVWVPENPDYLGYTAGPFAVCLAGGAALVALLVQRAGIARIIAGACLVLVMMAALLAPPALFRRSRARDTSARLLAAGALAEAPRRAILLVESDHWVWPLLYLQEVEGVRPDVVVLPLGLGSSSWFWQHLAGRHPELAAFPLMGPGGRIGRVHRFLAAQGDRPRAFEHLGMAHNLGAAPAAVGFLLYDRPATSPIASELPTDPELATAAIARAAEAIGSGSPDGTGVLALTSYARGEALWRSGHPGAAYRALLAGVPPHQRPAAPPPASVDHAPPPPGPLPPATGLRGLGNPDVNVAIAQAIASR
jgi:Protein of unknown function (DUF2723)